MIRSFLAIALPETIHRRIEEVQGDLKSSHADVRWVNPGKIHLTLKFFGNIDEAAIESIVKAVEESVRAVSPFSLKVRGIGAFPNWRNPRVVWMGLIDGGDILIPFQKQVEMELQKIGFEPEERAFRPHLTLGRVNSARGKEALIQTMEEHREQEFGEFEVSRVVLFKSDLKPTGPIYTPLREVNLGR